MAYKDITPKNNYLDQAILNKARIDKFILTITLPEALREIDVSYAAATESKVVSKRLQMSVWGALIPTINVPAVGVPYQGQVPKVTSFSRPAYEPVKVNFNVDSEFYNYYVIWKWLALLNNPTYSNFDNENISGLVSPSTNKIIDKVKVNFIPKYSTEISLKPLNEYNQVIGEFVYTQCFPVSLDGINFNYQESQEIVSGFTFEFSQLTFSIVT